MWQRALSGSGGGSGNINPEILYEQYKTLSGTAFSMPSNYKELLVFVQTSDDWAGFPAPTSASGTVTLLPHTNSLPQIYRVQNARSGEQLIAAWSYSGTRMTVVVVGIEQ